MITGSDPPKTGAKNYILVVDDNSTFRRFLVRAVCSMGYWAVGVNDGQEMESAMENQFPPDIVILDWNLAHGTAQEIHQSLVERRIPVVVMTGDPGTVESNVDRILTKPFTLDLLHSILEPGKKTQ